MKKAKNVVALALVGVMTMSGCFSALAAEETDSPNIQVTVSSENEQEIKGWGATPSVSIYQEGFRQYLESQVYKDFGFTIMRFQMDENNGFYDGTLIKSNVVREADAIERMVKAGISQYMLSAWSPPEGMSTLNGDNANEVYGRYYVNFLDYITKERGLPAPVAISIQNEPGITGVRWSTHTYSGEEYVATFLAVSKALDEAGYGDILMIGAEASGYATQLMQLGADFSNFERYPEFLENFDAWCTHSYRDAAVNGVVRQSVQNETDKYLEDIARYPQIKDHWQTEYCGWTDSEDQVLGTMQLFNADLGLLKFNYWFWWTAYPMTWEEAYAPKDGEIYALYWKSNGNRKAEFTRVGKALSTVFKNVPVGSYGRRVDTDDPNAFVYGQACMDTTAFSTKNGTVLIYINQNYEDKTYDFNNLEGKTAKIYQFQSPDKDMQVAWEGDIKDGKLENVTLPGRSTNIIVCNNEDKSAPNINFETDYSVAVDDATYTSDTRSKKLVFNLDEPASVTVNGKKVKVDSDNKFYVNADTSIGKYKIEASDKYGNKRTQNIRYNYVEGYLNNAIDPIPQYYSKEIYNVTGTVNKPVEISVNGEEPVKVDVGRYSVPVELHDGENDISLVTKDENGKTVTNEFVVFNDIRKPSLDILTEKEVTTSDNEYILRFQTDKELTDVRINGKYTSPWGLDYRFCYNDDKIYDYVLVLEDGVNKFDITISDKYGNTASDTVTVNYIPDDNVAVESTGVINAKKAKSSILLDGKLDESDWLLNNKVMKRYQERDKSIVHFGVTYDDEALYVGAEITDNSYLRPRAGQWHFCDDLEIYIDGGNEKYGIYDDNDMQLFCGYDKDGVKATHATRVYDYEFVPHEDGSITVEARIPWSTIGGKPELGRKIGFDLQIDDIVSTWDTAGIRSEPVFRNISLWNGTTYSWTDSSTFGTVILSE